MYAELIYKTPNMLKIIERAGRVCYRSESKITDASSSKFVSAIVKSGHESVIEHSNLIFKLKYYNGIFIHMTHIYTLNNLIRIIKVANDDYFLAVGNVRMFKDLFKAYDNNIDFKYNPIIKDIGALLLTLPEPLIVDLLEKYSIPESQESYDENANMKCNIKNDNFELFNIDNIDIKNVRAEDMLKLIRVTYKIREPRILTQQETRHRLSSYSQESQRYVDYIDGFKYHTPVSINPDKVYTLENGMKLSYNDYFNISKQLYREFRKDSIKKEDARGILPNYIYSEIVITKSLEQIVNFIRVRGEKTAQLEIRERCIDLLDAINLNCDLLKDKYTIDREKSLILENV